MVSLFCRHNRFTADCPICSRGTVLDSTGSERGGGRSTSRAAAGTTGAPRSGGTRPASSGRRGPSRGAVTFRGGPSASVGPYERDGETYEVRLERVPGGLRLAEWSAGQLRPAAPVLAARDVSRLIADAAGARALEPTEHEELGRALADVPPEPAPFRAVDPAPEAGASGHGASPGRSGELRDELRVERIDGDRLRIARWVFRPGTGWDLLDAPTMLPARRYAEALADAARRSLLAV
ncbi:MAG: hypothetical protein WKF33_02150 [Thermoleophilaceae bacterium]